MKKIIYSVFGLSGGGHVASARAIIAAMEELKIGPFEHKIVDFSVKVKTFFTNFVTGYYIINEYFPAFWKTIYESTNDPRKVKGIVKAAYSLLYARKMRRILEEEKPDMAVSMVGPMNMPLTIAVKDLPRPLPIVTVVLDPVTFHASWVHPNLDRLIVATEEAYQIALKYGMPAEKVRVVGFPIHPRFLKDTGTREGLRREFDLEPHLFTVLVMGGGSGIGKIRRIVRILNKSDLDIQLLVVAGFNKRLELKLLKKRFRFPVKIFGFTDRIPEIMSAADVLVTKAGPGAVFEAAARELPLIITGNIPGQEEGNVDYVRKHKLGIIAHEPEEIIEAIRRMQSQGTEEFKANMRSIRNPAAVYEIAKLIAGYLE